MGVATRAVTASSTRSALTTSKSARVALVIAVPAGGATAYIGGGDVTAANGIPVPAGQPVTMEGIAARAAWSIITASASQDVRVGELT